MSSGKKCDNASVGVLIERQGRWLLLWRANPPVGIAPVAGHVFDEHKNYRDAAVAEVEEELGLTVEELRPAGVGGWRPNKCRREPGPKGTGHEWEVFTATVSGELRPSPAEASMARWLSHSQVQLLANRTLLHALGRVGDADFGEYPGIEPVWVEFLASLGVIRMSAFDLEMIARLAAGTQPDGTV